MKYVRVLSVLAPMTLLVLPACESLGIKANITTIKSVNGHTEVKQREAKNWDEFSAAMSEVGTDFSDVAKEVGSTTAELAKSLVEAPPPGKVKLADLDPALAKFDGNESFDFIAAARKKADAPYDFTYVQVGVPSYDNFFRTAAEVYALAFQMKETARRVRVVSEEATGSKFDAKLKTEDIAAKAKGAKTDENSQFVSYVEDLNEMWAVMGVQGAKLVSKSAELVSNGQALIAGAPSSITNPKTALHLDLIVKGLGQSIDLIKDSASMVTELVQ